ncbi:DUF2878 domain-containing protein [Endozoicomonas numazuensis]|uniref:DUF2878 domain-containing protein n=1 Tax=Endozoicomonas numazuensis TaxID=1137799 RepID=UPI00068F5838|nr:DUF2878 domain-containing protein [Endozoicomonas numazuensis]
MKQLNASWLNSALALTGWLICMATQSIWAIAATAVILMIHFSTSGSWKKEREILVITLILGSALDSVMSNLSILHFTGDSRILPSWLASVWIMLGLTIRHSLSWISKNRRIGNLFLILLTAVHYSLLIQFTYVSSYLPNWQSVIILSLSATVLINIIMIFSDVWLERYRRQNP